MLKTRLGLSKSSEIGERDLSANTMRLAKCPRSSKRSTRKMSVRDRKKTPKDVLNPHHQNQGERELQLKLNAVNKPTWTSSGKRMKKSVLRS